MTGTVLVTGGCGFIGRYVVKLLVDRGEDVVVLDSFLPQSEPQIPPGVRMIQRRVNQVWDPSTLPDSIDRIVHLAALVGVGQSMYQPYRYVSHNTLDTTILMTTLGEPKWRERITRLVVASSMSCYGEGAADCVYCLKQVKPRLRDEYDIALGWVARCPNCGGETTMCLTDEGVPMVPGSIYAITKRDQEEICLMLGHAMGLPTVALRLFNVYGPGQALSNPYTGVTAIFGCRLLNDEPPLLYEDGKQQRDFIHVEDVARGIVAALDSRTAVGAINLGTGLPRSLSSVAHLLATAHGKEIEPQLTGRWRAGDVRHCVASVRRAYQFLNWKAQIKLEDGLVELAAWQREQHRPLDNIVRAQQELEAAGLLR